MNLAITKNRKHHRPCEFLGCTNIFFGIGTKKYCDDPSCKERRTEYFKTIVRIHSKEEDVQNIMLVGPRYKKKLRAGQALRLRCRAKSANGNRCTNKFLITFDAKQSTYPMFCECHRSSYRRERFKLQKG